jgi:hypothetical protein
VQANLFDSGRRQDKAALASTKADRPSLPEYKNLLLVAQKQLVELPFIVRTLLKVVKGYTQSVFSASANCPDLQ